MMANICTSPYLPGWEYVPDGEPHVFGDRVYIFGSHDRFGGKDFCVNDYVCYSASVHDLANWKYEGIIFCKNQDPDNPEGKRPLFAPDVAQGPDGRYYLYYCMANYPKIGVAVADLPAGPYAFLNYVQDKNGEILGQRVGDTLPFDPAVLHDSDGHIHLFAGQGPMNAAVAKYQGKTRKWPYHMELEPDMFTIRTEPKPVIPSVLNSVGTGFEGHEFFEASSIRKFDGRYYFIYSSVQGHELCWAVSDRPDGGYHYGGTLVSNGDIGLGDEPNAGGNKGNTMHMKNYIGNNHGSVERINGSYYIFYHRQTNRHLFSRQACVAKIQMLEDGHFVQAEMTSCGLGDHLPGIGMYEARIACQLYSAKGAQFSAHPLIQNKSHPAFTQDEPDGEGAQQYIANMRNGAVAVFKYFAMEGADTISVVVRGKCDGEVVVSTGENGKIVARIPVKHCKAWTEYSADLTKLDGILPLSFTYVGKGCMDFLSLQLRNSTPH